MFNFSAAQNYNFFGLEFQFDKIAFSLGNFSVYWYGIIIALGFGLALVYGMKNAKRFGIDPDRMIDVVIVGLLGAIICARGYYLLFDGVPLSNFARLRIKWHTYSAFTTAALPFTAV